MAVCEQDKACKDCTGNSISTSLLLHHVIFSLISLKHSLQKGVMCNKEVEMLLLVYIYLYAYIHVYIHMFCLVCLLSSLHSVSVVLTLPSPHLSTLSEDVFTYAYTCVLICACTYIAALHCLVLMTESTCTHCISIYVHVYIHEKSLI